MGTAALLLGVVGLVLAVLLIFFPVAFITGVLAVIFGAVGIARANRGEASNRSHALAGLICGALAVILAVVIAIRIGTFVNANQADFRRFWSCITSAPTEDEQRACGEALGRDLEGE